MSKDYLEYDYFLLFWVIKMNTLVINMAQGILKSAVADELMTFMWRNWFSIKAFLAAAR